MLTRNRKGHFCVYCNQIYKESDADEKEQPWIGCDSCHRWVHQHCEKSNGFEITPNGYLCPCCRNQQNIGTPSTITAAALSAAANKHYEPILMKPGSGAVKSSNKDSKKRRRKPTLETGTKKVKQTTSPTTSSSQKPGLPLIDTKLPRNSSFNKLITPISISPSSNSLNRLSAPSTSSTNFDMRTQSSSSLYDMDAFYKDTESQCLSPTASSKLSISSDDEYSYDSDSDDDILESSFKPSHSRESSLTCGADFVEPNSQEFIIWDPLHDKKSIVGVSFEEVESAIAKNFGYSTPLTNKMQSLSAICACELFNMDQE